MQWLVIVLALVLALSVGGKEERAKVKNTVGVKVEMGSKGTSTEVSIGTEIREGSAKAKFEVQLPSTP